MYSFLRGTVLAFEDGKISLLVENTGLGLEVSPTPLLFSHARLWESLDAYVHHHVTDVSEALFAFANPEEKRFFKKLLKVDGVGGKTALALLGLGIPTLAAAIETGDEKTISSVSGVGKKTALKVIVELKKEVSASDLEDRGASPIKSKKPEKPTSDDPEREAILVSLVSMGYDRKVVESALDRLPEEAMSVTERTVQTLRMLSK